MLILREAFAEFSGSRSTDRILGSRNSSQILYLMARYLKRFRKKRFTEFLELNAVCYSRNIIIAFIYKIQVNLNSMSSYNSRICS